MRELAAVVEFGISLISVFGAALIARLLWLFYRDENKEYNERYKEFSEQKDRVEVKLKTGDKRTSDRHIVRDFIYLDVERMYSLYSQVFEGVAESIAESTIDRSQRTAVDPKRPLPGKSVETEVAEASLLTENKILHDYMYTRLEEALATVLRQPDVSEDVAIHHGDLVKVRGTAEVADSNYLRLFLARYNDLGAAIAYESIKPEGHKEAVFELEDKVRHAKSENERKKLEAQLAQLLDRRPAAGIMNLRLEEQSIRNLELLLDMFVPDVLEVSIVPGGGDTGDVFRGILDRRWLRLAPDYLRALYGSVVEAQWTVVGQVTYIPSEGDEQGEQTSATEAPTERPMRDRYRNMFKAITTFEGMFMASAERTEYMVRPLAIYQEIAIPSGGVPLAKAEAE